MGRFLRDDRCGVRELFCEVDQEVTIVPRVLAKASCIVSLALTLGCFGTGNESDESAAIDVLHFEQIDIPALTTDRASTGGVNWVDFDGDNDLDLFVVNGYDVSAENPVGQPNHLYRNEGGGTFVEVTIDSLAASNSISSASTWGDYDNDGDLDVFIANQQDLNNCLFRNDGNGIFAAVVDGPQVTDGGHSYAATWVDIDGDGWLDLFVANGGLSHAGRNCLYRGIGEGRFEKVTEGDLVTDEAATCGIAWGDYDNDGDLDLFLANQGFVSPANNNALYRNDGDWTFTRITEGPAVNDSLPSSAATWVDVDNDLDLDLHVTSMYGLADRLYLNDGSSALSPAEDSPLTLDGGHSLGANWEDYDNDGDLDAVIANWGAAPNMYLNDGHGIFSRVHSGDLSGRIQFAGAIASGDYDADGNIDVYLGNWPNQPGPGELNCLYRNRGLDRHWLRVRLAGTKSNRSGIGARVLLTSRIGDKTVTQIREVSAQMGFRGQSDMSAHFGLDSADEAISIEVRWPSGEVSKLESVAGEVVEVVEPKP